MGMMGAMTSGGRSFLPLPVAGAVFFFPANGEPKLGGNEPIPCNGPQEEHGHPKATLAPPSCLLFALFFALFSFFDGLPPSCFFLRNEKRIMKKE
jgi:hypothetical protein